MTRQLYALALVAPLAASSVPAQAPSLSTGPVTRIAFGSCAKQWQAQPIWEVVLEADPDL